VNNNNKLVLPWQFEVRKRVRKIPKVVTTPLDLLAIILVVLFWSGNELWIIIDKPITQRNIWVFQIVRKLIEFTSIRIYGLLLFWVLSKMCSKFLYTVVEVSLMKKCSVIRVYFFEVLRINARRRRETERCILLVFLVVISTCGVYTIYVFVIITIIVCFTL